MRTTMISLVIVLIIAFAAPFFVGPGGKPMLSLDKIKGPALPDLSGTASSIKQKVGEMSGESAPGGAAPSPTGKGADAVADQIYKWRDANGQWVFGNTPPPGVKAERVRLDPKANVLSTVQVQSSGGGSASGRASGGAMPSAAALGAAGDAASGFNPPDPSKGLTPQNIRQTVESARNMQGVMDARKAAMDAAGDGR